MPIPEGGATETTETVLPEQSISVAGRPLPALPATLEGASIVLFYQYKEPVWNEADFQKALKLFLSIGRRFSMTGRGRMAPEGINCTLTGPSPIKVRGFCQALRDEWSVVVDGSDNDRDLFHKTDFKITDGLPPKQLFKSLSIRKTNELVAYGLEGEKAPSIEKFGGTHLNAMDYHKALQDKNTVVIDVRNAYETAIGTILPPKGGATLLDPKLRNSREWPKWLASEETQKKLNGKKILTFCTGGIRCERATALINQMATVSQEQSEEKKDKTTTFEPQGVYHMRGGIERYLKTYPKGGFWSGKNYLFDKRMEQLPELKDSSQVEEEVTRGLKAKCCLCRKPWTTYRGQHKCGEIQCGVPVLVCDACHHGFANETKNMPKLVCELCREGYRAPQGNPDLVAMRKQAEKIVAQPTDENDTTAIPKHPPRKLVSDRLFLNRLPLNTSKSEIQNWLQTPLLQFHWVTDRTTGAFYGSCIVRIGVFSKILWTLQQQLKDQKPKAKEFQLLLAHKTNENHGKLREFLGPFPGTLKARKKGQQPKVFRVLARPDEVWPPQNHCDSEFPPLGDSQLQ